MSVIFEGIEMPKACCFVDGEHSSFAHFEYCKFYNICKQRETIKTNIRPGDCPVKPINKEMITKNDLASDCISRAEMLRYQEYLHGKMSNEENHKLWKFIKALPSVTPWISVSERLPEDHKDVLAYLSSDRISICRYNSHKLPFSNDPIGWGYLPGIGFIDFEKEHVIAWMPLPKPYREVEK